MRVSRGKKRTYSKKSVWKSLVRVFDASASREGTRAPGEETQGIRPPFLNFFYTYVFLSFNACVINLSLSLCLVPFESVFSIDECSY